MVGVTTQLPRYEFPLSSASRLAGWREKIGEYPCNQAIFNRSQGLKYRASHSFEFSSLRQKTGEEKKRENCPFEAQQGSNAPAKKIPVALTDGVSSLIPTHSTEVYGY